MNKQLMLAGLLAFVLGSYAQAGVIYSPSAAGVIKTEESYANTIDFESGCGYVTCSGNYEIRNTSARGVSAAPFAASPSPEYFLSIPEDGRRGKASFTLDGDYDYFGLFWGSIDRYNFLSFYNDGSEIARFGGRDLPPLQANGGQKQWSSNRFINFHFTDGWVYDKVVLISNGRAFETDNHAYGRVAVSEPSAFALLGLGIVGLALARRSSRTA